MIYGAYSYDKNDKCGSGLAVTTLSAEALKEAKNYKDFEKQIKLLISK